MSTGERGRLVGYVVGGSLGRGVEVRLAPEASLEEVAVGSFLAIQGERRRFLAIITDVSLETTDPDLRSSPPDPSDPFLVQAMAGTAAYGVLRVRPAVVLPPVLEEGASPLPAKTVPPPFAPAFQATDLDIAAVFGREEGARFSIGTPLDMEATVCLDMEELIKRSNGVFGKSGTGKSFFTRLLLIGLLQKGSAVSLVFDMHSEYGWKGRDERGREVPGLKALFPSRVALFTLDPESALRRGVRPEGAVRIPYRDLEPEDIDLLAETLRLTELARQAVYRLPHYLDPWLPEFLSLDEEGMKDLARRMNESPSTLQALRRRLETLRRFPFLVSEEEGEGAERILSALEAGRHTVLEFGRYERHLEAYILVANVLTRRIHHRYVERTERALGEGAPEPRPLVIVIEEAHKFLAPGVAAQTTFGTIARELRKYNVTLLVVDQRPSGIDPEVMSQLGTRVSFPLDNEKDIDAVLSGAPDRADLRQVLARLESRQQALLFGHALPIPVVVQVRDYGTATSLRNLVSRGEAQGREDELYG